MPRDSSCSRSTSRSDWHAPPVRPSRGRWDNRAELGEFDALVLGLFLIGQFEGQVVIPDFGFYGRDAHVSLIRENRLIGGVNFLGELPPKLRHSALLIKDKVPSGATVEDAETLAVYARLTPGTNGFNEFVQEAIA